MGLDMTDKRLLAELSLNCRQSYQTLARKLGLTVNAIKKRVDKLLESGVIVRFTVALCCTRYGLTQLAITLSTDGNENKVALIQQLGDTRQLTHVVNIIEGRYVSVAQVSGVEELLDLERTLRGIDHVTQVEINRYHVASGAITSLGQKPCVPATDSQALTFTKLQKQVLRCLVDDARMPVVEIARQSKLTPKRVRSVLKELQTSGNIHFTHRMVLGAGEDFDCIVKVGYNPGQGGPLEIVEWFKERYPLEHWHSHWPLEEPEVWNKLVVTDLRTVEEISEAVKELPMVQSVETLIYHAMRIFPAPNETRLHQMLDLSSE
ncbi:MAG: winged helix-turn-helix transcriptional regulator [Promethearchaeota archaeon]